MAKKLDLVKELATRAHAIDYFSMGQYLPNPDPVLKKMGRDITAYREVLSDSHVAGCVRRRKAAIKGLEWRITPTGNQKVDEMLTALFEHLPLSQIITEILDATLFGYQVLEVIWQHQNGLWLPAHILGKPQEWFVFDEQNQLMLRDKENHNGKPVPEKKFLLATQEASYTNPYGRPDLSLCFWAATFKRGGFKFWLEFTEKYGSPWLVGKHPRQAQTHEIEDLLDSMEKMIGTAVAAIPDDSSIGMLESSNKGGSSQVFDEFLKYCKSEIAIAILGQNQTTEQESNRASATAGLEVTKEIRNEDAALVENCLNQLLNWICELNFNVETLPKFELYEQESIDKVQVERDQILSQMGISFSLPYLQRTYGFDEGDISLQLSPQPQLNALAEFSEDKPMTPIDCIIEQVGELAQHQFDDRLAEIRAKLDTANSLEEFRDLLDKYIEQLNYREYAKLYAEGMTSAILLGRYEVVEEGKR